MLQLWEKNKAFKLMVQILNILSRDYDKTLPQDLCLSMTTDLKKPPIMSVDVKRSDKLIIQDNNH